MRFPILTAVLKVIITPATIDVIYWITIVITDVKMEKYYILSFPIADLLVVGISPTLNPNPNSPR